MRLLRHPQTIPHDLQSAVVNGATNWDSFKGKAAVRQSLDVLQQGLCAYCQIRLDRNIGCHIEHVRPKHLHPALTFQWNNLVLSCTDAEHIKDAQQMGGVSCGHSSGKSQWLTYDARFISPTDLDCERYFEYRASDGSIQPAKDLSQPDVARANYTIALLNLNCRRLCRERKDMLEEGYRIIAQLRSDTVSLRHFLDCEFAEIGGKLRAFFTSRQQHFLPFLLVSDSPKNAHLA